MNITRTKLRLVLVLLALLLAIAWALSTQRSRLPNGTPDALVSDLHAEPPWYNSLLQQKRLQRVLPRKWLLRAELSNLQLDQRRWAAVDKLSALGTNAWPQVPALLSLLAHTNLSVRVAAAVTLAGIQAEAHPDWEQMEKVLNGQTRAARVLQHLAVSMDWRRGRRYDLACRRFGLIGLAATGPASVSAKTDLLGMVKSTDEVHELRALAVLALGRIGKKESVLLLRGLLADTQEWADVRAAAALALADTAAEESETRNLLAQTLTDERALVRLGAAQALWKMGAPAAEVLPTLEPLLKHKLITVRTAALNAVAAMGKPALPLKPEVEQLSSDQNESVRRAAARALKRIAE